MQLSGYEDRKPAQLSGGQQQRVALARALVFEPKLVLMDEPLGALDKQLRERMQMEIKHLHQRLGITMVYVTHDQTEAMTMSDRIAVFNAGRIQQLDTAAGLYERPINSFVAQFIGENNRLVGDVVARSGDSCRVRLDGGAVVRARAVNPGERRTMLSIRPERAVIDPPPEMADNRLPAIVQELIYLGDHRRVRLSVAGNSEFIVKVGASHAHGALDTGTTVTVGVALGRLSRAGRVRAPTGERDSMLTTEQRDSFRSEGYLLLPGLVDPASLAAVSRDVDGWIEESRGHDANWGDLPAGKKRFDLEPGHGATRPRLRRIANPVDISEAHRTVLWSGALPQAVADLIGPDVKFHHCKLNLKLSGMSTVVGWHQDHAFDPHTNDSIVVALVMLDDTDVANGCLQVVPGSHREKLTHYQGEKFTGEIPATMIPAIERGAVPVPGRAGDVLLIDTWMVHGSPANRTDTPRRMLICDYTAADAFPLTRMSVPTVHAGRIVHGHATRVARLRAGAVELPPAYSDDSFFSVQAPAAGTA